ncbi:lysosomal Pro-X carboxypeptidase-like [Amblyomma americanum]
MATPKIFSPLLTVFFAAALAGATQTSGLNLTYKIHTFDALIDHFTYNKNTTFQLRYAIADQYWNRKGGPIFFHTGHQGSVEEHVSSVGIMWNWARDFKAVLVFAEHRYYGQSLPFGKDSFKAPEMTAYLTTEQALADYAELITWIKKNVKGAQNSRVAAFGCHYEAMLATWFRVKYPHIVRGVLASSAPFKILSPFVSCDTYFKAATDAYKKTSKNCPNEVRKIWPVLEKLASTEEGCQSLGRKFRLCAHLRRSHFPAFRNWLRDSLIGVALVNYPYPTSHAPPHPLKAVCELLRKAHGDTDQLVDALVKAVGFFRNNTGKTTCYAKPVASKEPAWLFQQCTEFVHPVCGDGVKDMFYPTEWDFGKVSQKCWLQFGITPTTDRVISALGGANLSGTSRVFYSTGNLDPWAAYGVEAPPTRSNEFRNIRGGAHCLDLRFANSRWDPHSLRLSRRVAKRAFRRWLSL